MAIALGLLASFGIEIAAGGTLGVVLGVLRSPGTAAALKLLRFAKKLGDRPLTPQEKKNLEYYRARQMPNDLFGKW